MFCYVLQLRGATLFFLHHIFFGFLKSSMQKNKNLYQIGELRSRFSKSLALFWFASCVMSGSQDKVVRLLLLFVSSGVC